MRGWEKKRFFARSSIKGEAEAYAGRTHKPQPPGLAQEQRPVSSKRILRFLGKQVKRGEIPTFVPSPPSRVPFFWAAKHSAKHWRVRLPSPAVQGGDRAVRWRARVVAMASNRRGAECIDSCAVGADDVYRRCCQSLVRGQLLDRVRASVKAQRRRTFHGWRSQRSAARCTRFLVGRERTALGAERRPGTALDAERRPLHSIPRWSGTALARCEAPFPLSARGRGEHAGTAHHSQSRRGEGGSTASRAFISYKTRILQQTHALHSAVTYRQTGQRTNREGDESPLTGHCPDLAHLQGVSQGALGRFEDRVGGVFGGLVVGGLAFYFGCWGR